MEIMGPRTQTQDIPTHEIEALFPDHQCIQTYVEPKDVGHAGIRRRRTFIFIRHKKRWCVDIIVILFTVFPFFPRIMIKGSLGGETSVLRTFRMAGKELVKERVSKETVSQGKS